MNYYNQRVADRILPLSIADSVPEAILEWLVTGVTTDHEQAIETCELCGQDRLRYHFEIANRFTKKRLDIGSECILRFDVPVFENDRKLSATETKRYLNAQIQQMRLESCIRALEKLANAERNQILTNALAYYQRNKKLTPKYAFVVFWKLDDHKIDYEPSFFKIRLDRQSYKDALREMNTARVHRFWRALSPAQRKIAIELGHTAPD